MSSRKSRSNGSKPWWNFTGENENFEARQPDRISRLYFPLCNEEGLLSAITPTFGGDIKTDQNRFLTLPVSEQDLHNTRSGRHFWIYLAGKGPWSATGSSATSTWARGEGDARETCRLEAGALWHRMTRENRLLGLRSVITNFVPAGPESVEIMQVEITNTGRKPLSLTATAAIPIFGRSADNLRDHRHVSSLLHRIEMVPQGVLVTPAMSFNESGHYRNSTVYGVLACEGDGQEPAGSFPTVASFIGEGGTFDAPRAVLEDWDLPDLSDVQLQGREAIGAIRFRSRKLAPGKSATYIVMMGIAKGRKEALGCMKAYSSSEKVQEALQHNREHWREKLDRLQVQTDDVDYGRWVRWVVLQPILRKIFGCSFLPDFDYGRGGRGWRDLWQDCLALLLLDERLSDQASKRVSDGPEVPHSPTRPLAHSLDVRSLLLNNFAGVRMNGTNATIIGQEPGEFVADRNNISRTWMDHGVWPWMTTELYLHQAGDLKFLLEDVPYFWDQDKANTETPPRGTVLEHLLVQHLTAYFNVGEHGHCRLEDADWNDGLDMASDRGESVAFTAVYAGNLIRLAETLRVMKDKIGVNDIPLAEEMRVLLDVPSPPPSPDMHVGRGRGEAAGEGPEEKQIRLRAYRSVAKSGISGRKIRVAVTDLAEDLRKKGEALAAHVRDKEWIKDSAGHAWFNGYYDNRSERVEGDRPKNVRMTLTGQVFPVMSGVATNEQVAQCFAAAERYLKDKKLGGFRLNTDFEEQQLPLGRAFSFAYGEKENGSFFSHMSVMFAHALYRRGFVEEGAEVLASLYRMAMNAETAKIYPGLPEYFNGEGRGMYHYLTGSASWYLLTLVTQVLGIRGHWGDLRLAPKLVPEQFGKGGQISAQVCFAGKTLKVTYLNRARKAYGQYRIQSLLVQGNNYALPDEPSAEVTLPRSVLTRSTAETLEITVSLA
jgi:cellobiose phosphorylase